MGAGRGVARATRDLSSQSPVLTIERINAIFAIEVLADSTLGSMYYPVVERIEQGIFQAASGAVELNVLTEIRIESNVLPQLH